MAVIDRVRDVVVPILEESDVELYDLDLNGGVLKVLVDREGGIDLDTVASVSSMISREMDLVDPIPSAYTLEVSSPGIERPLRTPAHYAGAVGERVRIKLAPGGVGPRRRAGVLLAIVDDELELRDDDAGEIRIPLSTVTRARTEFDWAAETAPRSRPTTENATGSDS